MTIGEYIRKHQPEVYTVLMSMIFVDQAVDPDKALREVEKLMRHDAYVREHGAIRQVRRG